MKHLFLLITLIVLLSSCKNSASDNENTSDAHAQFTGPMLFEKLPTSQTGIDFVNTVKEDETLNYLTFNYIYMSGAAAAADFNGDGLMDLYMSATTGENKLYQNKGNFAFEDIAKQAGVQAGEGVKTGVSIVDINTDGKPDIYQCRTGNTPESRGNLLFINTTQNGVVSFVESAAQYGLVANCPSTHANFFDYDRDGDLDMYLLNHRTDFNRTNDIRVRQDGQKVVHITEPVDQWTSDRLYKNEGNNKFTDVSQNAGIMNYAYGLSVTVLDANRDGWPDLYVCNDYVEPDNLFINNKNGTFTDRINDVMRHTSTFSMGCDIGDVNNDGLEDLLSADMQPINDYRQKVMATSMIPDRYTTMVSYGYGHQMMRNMLQLNNGDGTYSEIGCLAGVYATDWSWAPLMEDFDNDGYRDLFMSNGQRKDVNNLDYTSYSIDSIIQKGGGAKEAAAFMNSTKPFEYHNFMFRNKGDLTFEDVSIGWGLGEKTISNSAVFADFDNDGDQDIVVVNSFKPAFVYKNKARELGTGNYLQVKLEGGAQNPGGYGSSLLLETAGHKMTGSATPHRGFISASSDIVHFGLGKNATVEKLHIQWPDGKVQTLENVPVNQKITLKHSDAKPGTPLTAMVGKDAKPLFSDVSSKAGSPYKHQENGFFDFTRERLIPRMYSNNGPCLAVADVNGDGLDDFYSGGSFGFRGLIGIQQANGSFKTDATASKLDTIYEDTDAIFFDADGDTDQDLYVVSGGNEAPVNSRYYQDRLYINDGKGKFTPVPGSLPTETESGGCVAAYDYDTDGDLDLFVGGRVLAGGYPRTPYSYIMQNNGGKFSHVTTSAAPEFSQIGMVSDLVFADLDGDKTAEMIVCGDWMPIEVFKIEGGKCTKVTSKYGLEKSQGWWQSVAAADLDGDGDMDLVAGNTGLNTRYRASIESPIMLYANDFDHNGSIDPLMAYKVDGVYKPVAFRDQMIKQLPILKKKYVRYANYASASIEDVFPKKELEAGMVLSVTELRNMWFENQAGKMIPHAFPNEAQTAPVRSILVADFDQNGTQDLLLAGNDYGTEIETGRYDAGNGTLLLNDGKGQWRYIPNLMSGFWAKKDARAVRSFKAAGGKKGIMVANNNDNMQVYWMN